MSPQELLKTFAEKATPNQIVALLGRGVKFFVGANWCYYDNGQWITVDGNQLPGHELPTQVDLGDAPQLAKTDVAPLQPSAEIKQPAAEITKEEPSILQEEGEIQV